MNTVHALVFDLIGDHLRLSGSLECAPDALLVLEHMVSLGSTPAGRWAAVVQVAAHVMGGRLSAAFASGFFAGSACHTLASAV